MNYRECPRYGEPDCCRSTYEKIVAHVEKFTVTLTFKDESTITINPWVVAQEQELPTMWTALRLENPAYEDIDQTKLTQKSRMVYVQHHHPGVIQVTKNRKCPFRN